MDEKGAVLPCAVPTNAGMSASDAAPKYGALSRPRTNVETTFWYCCTGGQPSGTPVATNAGCGHRCRYHDCIKTRQLRVLLGAALVRRRRCARRRMELPEVRVAVARDARDARAAMHRSTGAIDEPLSPPDSYPPRP